MTKTIIFNNKTYSIDESSLVLATTELGTHLSTTINGSGAVINLGGTVYNVDSTKLSAAANDFISYLGTIDGSGSKVVVNGIEYGVDSTKLNDAVVNLEVVLSGLSSGGGEAGLAPGLYRAGAISLYEEGNVDSASAMLETSWDDLVADGRIIVDNGTISVGLVLPDELPQRNEYGFYYGVLYNDYGYGYVFYEDGSVKEYDGDALMEEYPSNTVVYSVNNIYWSDREWNLTVSSDGYYITDDEGCKYSLGSIATFDGDLIMPNDGSITAIDVGCFAGQAGLNNIIIPDAVTSISAGAFADCTSLASIVIPDSVTSIDYEAFVHCTSLESVEIGDSVTSIGEGAFAVCESLTSVTIPDSVTSISAYSFVECSNLTEVTFEGAIRQWNTITKGENWDGSTGSYTIYCTDGQIAKDGTVSRFPSEGLEFTLNDDKASYLVTGIGTCEDTDVVIPSEYNGLPVTGIGNNAFSDYTALTSIVIPNSITYIGERPFLYCSNLTEATFKGTVEQWEAIDFGVAIWEGTLVFNVQCSDGYVSTK